MRIRDIDRFFFEIDKRLSIPIRVILIGGAAAILQGVDRATQDIDFELQVGKSKKTPAQIEQVQKAIHEAGVVTGIAPQYAEDIDRWSSIPLPKKNSRLYAKVGKVEVRILEPSLWAIGKLCRYLASDVDDLKTVLASSRQDPEQCARLWGRALGASPASNQQVLFRRQVESFFDEYAVEIWGKKTRPDRLKDAFLRSARQAKISK